MTVVRGSVRGAYRKRPTMSFGERSYEALELAFRLGGFTPAQHARFTGMDVRRSRRILAPLARYGLTQQVPIPTKGRSALFHHLSKKDSGAAIVMAAQRCGVGREAEARKQYKLFQLPGRAEHHHELKMKTGGSSMQTMETPRTEENANVRVGGVRGAGGELKNIRGRSGGKSVEEALVFGAGRDAAGPLAAARNAGNGDEQLFTLQKRILPKQDLRKQIIPKQGVPKRSPSKHFRPVIPRPGASKPGSPRAVSEGRTRGR